MNGNELHYRAKLDDDMGVILSCDLTNSMQMYDEKIFASLLKQDTVRAETYVSEMFFP